MKLGIFAKTFGGSLEQAFAAIAAAGFTCTQFNMACAGLASMPDDIPSPVIDAIRHAARAHRVEIVALSGTYNMIHPDVLVRRSGLSRLRTLAAACVRLETGLVTLCTGTRDPLDQWRHHPANDEPSAWRDLITALEVAIGIAEEYDIYLGIEPELANVVNSAPKARRLLDELGSLRLRIVLDPANLFERLSLKEQRDRVSAAVDLLGDRMAIAHAKDRWADGRFVAAGQGVLDYDHFIRCLHACGFTGPLIAHGLEAHEAASVSAFLSAVMARQLGSVRP